jgi:glycerol-3-phosphate responsive antiterminator
MPKHVAWQMEDIPGGLGDKMEDFVERMHQTGICLRDHFCRVKNPVVHVQAREKANSCLCHPDVIARIDSTNESKKQSFSAVKIEDTITSKRKKAIMDSSKQWNISIKMLRTYLVGFDSGRGEG